MARGGEEDLLVVVEGRDGLEACGVGCACKLVVLAEHGSFGTDTSRLL